MNGSVFQLAAPITKGAIASKFHAKGKGHNQKKASFFAILKNELDTAKDARKNGRNTVEDVGSGWLQSLLLKLFPELTEKDLQNIQFFQDAKGNIHIDFPKELMATFEKELTTNISKDMTQLMNIDDIIRDENLSFFSQRRISLSSRSDISEEKDKESSAPYIIIENSNTAENRILNRLRHWKGTPISDAIHFKMVKGIGEKRENNFHFGQEMWQFKGEFQSGGMEKIREDLPSGVLHTERTIEKFIQDTVKMLRANMREMIIRLEPPELGEIKVVAEMEKGMVNLKLQVEREDVRQMMESVIGDIKTQLEQNGVRSGDIMVWVKGEDFGNKEGFSQEYESNRRKGKNRNFTEEIGEVVAEEKDAYTISSLQYVEEGIDVWA